MKQTAAFALTMAATFGALAQQPTPEQTINAQQQVIHRANACVDAYTNWVNAEQRLAQALAQIEALKKQAEKPPAK